MTKYLFAQPWYKEGDGELLFKPYQHQIEGWQGLSWGIDKSWHFMNYNHCYGGLTTYGNPYALSNQGNIAVQFQNWYSQPQKVWQQGDTLTLGGMSRVEYNGGDAIAYADYYCRWKDVTTGKMWWMEARFFDDRGDIPETFIFDKYTGEAIYSAEIRKGGSDYYTLNAASNSSTDKTYNDWRYYGIDLKENHFAQLVREMNEKLGTHYSENPNDHLLQAYGATNELAHAELGGWNGTHFSNTFLRVE